MSKSKNVSFDSRSVLRKSELEKEYESAKESIKRKFGLNQILGRSKVVQELHEKIDKISLCDVNVLISGESGTGKELAARAIHYLSRRAGKPFIPVNCSAIPENLFENELFGHVKGAFTDAGLPQVGLVNEAEGGTLFLDEIGAVNSFLGDEVILHNRTGYSRDDIKKTYSTKSDETMQFIIGKEIKGDWRLKIKDLASEDVGTLNSWSIEVTYE